MLDSTTIAESKNPSLLQSALCGVFKGITVCSILHPLEVIKTHQQFSTFLRSGIATAKYLYHRRGITSFCQGLTPHLIKTSCRQVWCWPMITHLPPRLEALGFADITQQVITGLAIATVDVWITTPLERAQILTILTSKSHLSWEEMRKSGVEGRLAYWAKRSVGMLSFLTAQKLLRDRYRQTDEELTIAQLTEIGVQVALIVSIVSAPFDLINTFKQTHNSHLTAPHLKNRSTFFRGWPLQALSLVIHNITSVILIELLHSENPRSIR